MDVPETTPAGTRLLDAAESLFYHRSIGAVGVDLVADTAGVTKRTLYQRFGSKPELVAAYLARRAHRWQTWVLDELDGFAPGADTVLAVFDLAGRWAADQTRGCAFVNAWPEVEGTSGPGAEVIRAEKAWMRELFEVHAPSPDAASHLQLLYEGAHVVATTQSDRSAYARAARAAAAVLAGSS